MDERVRVVQGGRVIDHERVGDRLVSVSSASAGHPTRHRGGAFVLAAGGFESSAEMRICGLSLTVPPAASPPTPAPSTPAT